MWLIKLIAIAQADYIAICSLHFANKQYDDRELLEEEFEPIKADP